MRKRKFHIGLLTLLAVMSVLSLVGYVAARYMTTIEKKDNTVQFTAKLAESITITYPENITLIPGYDTSATYTITIKGRTKLPAELTVTFENTADAAPDNTGHKLLVDFDHEDGFEITDEGKTCIYKKDLAADSAGGDEVITLTIPLKVSQYVKSNKGDILKVSATLVEKVTP